MNAILLWFAAVDPAEILAGRRGWSLDFQREVRSVLGAVSLVIVLVVIWAVFFRKAGHRHRHHHHHHHDEAGRPAENPQARLEADALKGEEKENGHRRRRRRRHTRYARNPTLAETGGLPPLRPERPPGAPPP